ncbi:MAG: hypothetical protein JO250_06680 [Armatimonadetes bacterium]|nr:hypothetical protein [Armatimonadota bacterium]
MAGVGVTGSNNLALEVEARMTELNLIVRDPDSVRTPARWYQGLRDASHDFQRGLFDELCRSWALAACGV